MTARAPAKEIAALSAVAAKDPAAFVRRPVFCRLLALTSSTGICRDYPEATLVQVVARASSSLSSRNVNSETTQRVRA